jgi:molybdopterin converting factor small subunit
LGNSAEIAVRERAAVRTVWATVVAAHPEVAPVPVRFAVNGEYVKPTHRLADDDEMACFPPVSGGR